MHKVENQCTKPQDRKVNEFMVKNITTLETESYVERTFELSIVNKVKEIRPESRLIQHLQFKNWPNYGVPDAVGPISEFVKLVHQKAKHGSFQNPEFVDSLPFKDEKACFLNNFLYGPTSSIHWNCAS